MSELPNRVPALVEALTWVIFGTVLVLYAAFAIFLLLSPILFVFRGKVSPIDRTLAGFGFCLILATMALYALQEKTLDSGNFELVFMEGNPSNASH